MASTGNSKEDDQDQRSDTAKTTDDSLAERDTKQRAEPDHLWPGACLSALSCSECWRAVRSCQQGHRLPSQPAECFLIQRKPIEWGQDVPGELSWQGWRNTTIQVHWEKYAKDVSQWNGSTAESATTAVVLDAAIDGISEGQQSPEQCNTSWPEYSHWLLVVKNITA